MTRDELFAVIENRITQMREALAKLPDDTAIDVQQLFEAWEPGRWYDAGLRLRYGEKLYRVVQPHTSQADWTPDIVPALYAEVAKPGEEWPEWKQPTGAQDAYAKGTKVSYEGRHWISNVDNNVWAPTVFGWDEQP